MEDITLLKKKENNFILKLSFYIIGFGLFILFGYFFLLPINKNMDVIIHVSPNDSLIEVANELKDNGVIKSSLILRLFIYTFYGDKHIGTGDYMFSKNTNPLAVSIQLLTGRHKISPIKVTIIEGSTNNEIIDLLSNKLNNFNKDSFLSDERVKQGYLFPDTYFFYPLTTTDEIINSLTLNFKKRISSLQNEINLSKEDLSDIIIMASIIEKEAKGKEDSFIISGILWKRIKLGMPLQVDIAPITYKELGLPNIPINNPGLLAITSALKPQESTYLYYLHDKNGQIHYATDFKGHRNNIEKYLK